MPTITAPPPPTPSSPSPAPPPRPPVSSAPPPPASEKPARVSFEEDFNAEVASNGPAKAPGSPAKASEAQKPFKTPVKAADTSEKPKEAPAVETEDDGYDIPKPTTKPTPVIPADQPVKAPELRAAYAKAKEKIAILEKTLAEKAVKPIDDVERKTFTDQISILQKQLEAATETIRSAVYEQSKEFKDQYETPFIEAWNQGAKLAMEFPVTTPEGDTRQAVEDDFTEIMREPNEARAAQMALDKFGAGSATILNYRFKIRELHNARVKALQEYRATLAERTNTEKETQAKAREAAEQERVQNTIRFKALNDEAAAKYPQFFAPEEGDDEGNKLLEKGYQDVDKAFQGVDMPPEQRIRLHSAIRNKAAAFGRLVNRLAKKDAKIAELEGVIKDLRESAPGAGQVAGGEKSNGPMSIEDELRAEMKKGR